MNAGRLHAVLELVKQDYEKNETAGKLQAAIDALSMSITTPNESNAVAFRDALANLYAALDQSPSNSATPSQVEILKEIGAFDKVGSGLRSEIENTLNDNTVTPANALAELQRIGQGVGAAIQVCVFDTTVGCSTHLMGFSKFVALACTLSRAMQLLAQSFFSVRIGALGL
jgi:hypothetical protein